VLREPGVQQRVNVMSCRRKSTATPIRGELGVWVSRVSVDTPNSLFYAFCYFQHSCMFAMLGCKDMPIYFIVSVCLPAHMLIHPSAHQHVTNE
jgi:hypothetical protein